MSIVNTLVILGIVVCAIITAVVEDTLSAIISMGVLGFFVALEFLLLHAPNVAMAEGAVGAVLSTVIFIVALKKVKGGNEQ